MPRKPHQPATLGDTAGPIPAGHAVTIADEQETKAIEAEMAFEAARAIGQIEAMQFTRDIADLSSVQIFLKIKNNKAYRALTVKDADGKPRRVADLEEFCERFLGKSARRMQELASNYHLLGPQLFETAERIGFRAQDYRTLKALPADDQAVIKQAMAADDRDQVLDLLQEMAARHASEKAALTAKARESEETAEARSEVIAKKETRINEQEEAIQKLKRRIDAATPDEVGAQLRDEVSQFSYAAEAQILGNLRAGFQALSDHAEANGVTHENFMSGCLAQIEAALLTVRDEFAVKSKPDADPAPDWVRDERPAGEIVEAAVGDDLKKFRARMSGKRA